jgi:hypothetical protein
MGLIIVLILITAKVDSGQLADSYDTCYTRSNKIIIIPVFDTVKQLESANMKADTIINELQKIRDKLGIKDDTLKPNKDGRN